MQTRSHNRIIGWSNIKNEQKKFHNSLPKKLKRLFEKNSYSDTCTTNIDKNVNKNSYKEVIDSKIIPNKIYATQSMYLGGEMEDYKTIHNNTLSLSLATMTSLIDDEYNQNHNQNISRRNSHSIKRKASTMSAVSAISLEQEKQQQEHQQRIDIDNINKTEIDKIRKCYEVESKYMGRSTVAKELLRMTYFSDGGGSDAGQKEGADNGCSLLNEKALNEYELALLHIAREIHDNK